jgi:hypothetical protein
LIQFNSIQSDRLSIQKSRASFIPENYRWKAIIIDLWVHQSPT